MQPRTMVSLFCWAWILGVALSLVRPQCAQGDEPRIVQLNEYLRECGESFGCYFTIERLADRPAMPSPLSNNRKITVSEDPATMGKLIALLTMQLPGVTVSRDPQERRIIHLTEDRLSSVEDYVLSKKISLKYRGRMLGLMDKLHTIDSRIRMPTVRPDEAIALDSQTEVTVDVRETPLRRMATEVVPLRGYEPIIWIATTDPTTDKRFTVLHFSGWIDQGKPATPFWPAKVPLKTFLLETGEALNCYFTIERVEDVPNVPSLLTDFRQIHVERDPKTVGQVIEMLTAQLKGVTVATDPDRKDIIRLTEDRLTKVANYVMLKIVDLKFQGPLPEMVEKLHAIDPRVREQASYPIIANTVHISDSLSQVDVNVKDAPIRKLVTDAMPLKGYCRVIWIATTRSLAVNPYTELFFQGWEDPDVPPTK